jgi:PPOX class probable FMN-dependent enzyme
MLKAFDEVISTRTRLREVLGNPRGYSGSKSVDRIDSIFARFIAASPYVLIATSGSDGLLDISPKGDAAGFVEILDEKTLVIPDRPGNQRHDTFENLLHESAIALFFIIPGNAETLRVAGSASIVRDTDLQQRMAVNGKKPAICLVVHVEEAFMHCAKSIVRSKLWNSEFWPDRSNVPTLAESLKVHAKATESIEELQKNEDLMTVTRLY